MRTRRSHRGPRITALLGGFVAALAVVLLAPFLPLPADETTEPYGWPAVPSASDGPPAPPEQALHRATTATAGAAVRPPHPGGCLPGPVQPIAAALCGGRPGDSFGVTSPTSGPPLRILFCTWLN